MSRAQVMVARGNVLSLRLQNGRLAMSLGLAILGGWLLLALFAPWIAPYDPILQISMYACWRPARPIRSVPIILAGTCCRG